MGHLILILLSIAISLNAQAESSADEQFLRQEAHSRILFADAWSGAYVIGHYSEYEAHVRFDVCGLRDSGVPCERLARLPLDEREAYHQPVLAAFKAYKIKLAREMEASWFSFITGGAQSDDVMAVDAVITEIEKVGFSNWMLLSRANMQKLAPEFSHTSSFMGLVDALKEALTRSADE